MAPLAATPMGCRLAVSRDPADRERRRDPASQPPGGNGQRNRTPLPEILGIPPRAKAPRPSERRHSVVEFRGPQMAPGGGHRQAKISDCPMRGGGNYFIFHDHVLTIFS